MSLRRRVLVGFLLVAGVLVVTNLVLSATLHSFLLDRVDAQLLSASSSLERRGVRGERAHLPEPGAANGDNALTEYFIAVASRDASALTRLSSALDDGEQPPPRLERSEVLANVASPGDVAVPFTAPAESGDGSWRLIASQRGSAGRMTVIIGMSLNELEATLAGVRAVQLAATGAVLGALAVVSWWMLRLGVHPLTNMASTADAIAAGDLSHRVDQLDERTEAGRLGVAFNTMLERIEEAFRSREESEGRVRQFAADASHELRTPLTSIQGYTELWRAGGLRDDAALAEAMRRMEQEAHRMAALVEDLLLLARIDQRRLLDCAPVRLDVVVGDAVADARAVEPDRPLDLQARPVVVHGDEMRLRQVVGNLLANARLHTPARSRVRVSVTAEDGKARLEVADEGPGLAPEVASKVFERFYRADSSRSRGAGGTGLGLAIVAAVAEAHGGCARVDSQLGRGSRFIVELPVVPTQTPAEPAARTA